MELLYLMIFVFFLGGLICIPIYVAVSSNRQVNHLFSRICRRYDIDAKGSVWTSVLEATGEWNRSQVQLRSERYHLTSKRSGVRFLISIVPLTQKDEQSVKDEVIFDTVNQYSGIRLRTIEEQWSAIEKLLNDIETSIYSSS